jgi:sugar transferase (PEP-CTERM/EpsH1 system associated)
VTCLQIGGLERVVVNLVRGFRGTPYRMLVVCLEEGGPFVAEIEKLGGEVMVLGKKPGLSWRSIRQLAKYFRQEQVTIVHTHNPSPHFHGTLGAVLGGVPIRVHTKHGRNYPHIKKAVLLNHVLSWFTDVLVPVSDNVGDVARQIEKVNPRKVRRIWNGVDTDQYQSEVRPPKPVVGTVARLSPEKDQQTMLAAFRVVADQLPEARLMFVGDGPCQADLKATAEKLGLTPQVDFLGARMDVPALLPTMSLFTLSSLSEGISMTILEAMAAGRPIVATNVGGNREIVDPACGLIVPGRDPQVLGNAYLELLRDPVQSAKMGRAARQRVIDHFSLQAMVREYASLYEKLLEKKMA